MYDRETNKTIFVSTQTYFKHEKIHTPLHLVLIGTNISERTQIK